MGDVGVLESMYGSGSLTNNDIWWFVSAGVPIVMGVLSFIWVKCHRKKEEKEKVEHDEEWVKSVCETENQMLTYIFYFLAYMTGTGAIFLHLASICDWERPTAWWIGLYGLVPILLLALYAPFFVVLYELCSECECGEMIGETCRAVFCWCRGKKVQISAESSD
jgi:uncharacterized membrane protein HdeD (DUF308 family)